MNMDPYFQMPLAINERWYNCERMKVLDWYVYIHLLNHLYLSQSFIMVLDQIIEPQVWLNKGLLSTLQLNQIWYF
jgi:hypothetical protein